MRSRFLLVSSLLVTALACRSADETREPLSPSTSAETPEAMAGDGGADAPGAASQEPAAGELAGVGERVARLQGQQEFLVQQYLPQGDALFADADFEGALREFSSALEVDPDNQEARELSGVNRVQANPGDFGRTTPFTGRGAAVT